MLKLQKTLTTHLKTKVMKKKVAALFLGLCSLLSFNAFAQIPVSNQPSNNQVSQQGVSVVCNPAPCNTTINCNPTPCVPAPCDTIVNCTPAPCNTPVNCAPIPCDTTINCAPVPCNTTPAPCAPVPVPTNCGGC